jgi:hypothetical protein
VGLLNPDRRVTGDGPLRMKKYECGQCGKRKSDYYTPKCNFDGTLMVKAKIR